MPKLLLAALLVLAASCRHAHDPAPLTTPAAGGYDELALDTGHWEWERTVHGFSFVKTPATEGHSRQLLFAPSNQLVLRRSGQADYVTTYQLSFGKLPPAVPGQVNQPIITYTTPEPELQLSDSKTYLVEKQDGQLRLSLTGEGVSLDNGSFEEYHWVAE